MSFLEALEKPETHKLHMTSYCNITPDTVRRLNDGDIEAFNEIYHACYVYLSSIAIYYVHNLHVAKSIVNDVFVSFWEKRESITYPPISYLRQAVQNKSISHMRSRYFKETHLLDTDTKAWSWVENFILSSDDPLKALEQSDADRIIHEKIQNLPVACREIFSSRLYEGKTYEEISKERGISVSTVRVQIKRALDKLRDDLGIPLIVIILTLIR